MPSAVFAAENSGSKVYKVGRVGMDTGSQDAGGVFTATLKTERISPEGEGGLSYFRRALVRALHSGGFTATFTVYIDGVQTTEWSSGEEVDQSIAVTVDPPTTETAESLIELDFEGKGTYVEIQMSVDSDDVPGILLLELIEVHRVPLRPGRHGDAETT